MTTTVIGTGLTEVDHYSIAEKECREIIKQQIDNAYPNDKNLLINLTWFGPQFTNLGAKTPWDDLIEFEAKQVTFDNVFLLAMVDPPHVTLEDQQQIKLKVQALKMFYLGNFDGVHQFNFFAPVLAKHFKTYNNDELILKDVKHLYVNYNRKPKVHRVEFVKKLISNNLLNSGVVTLGKDPEHIHDMDSDNNLYLSIGESYQDYIGLGNTQEVTDFGLPMDYYTLHNMSVWKNTFLYINAATEFNPINDLFCQQDTFKPMLGLRPFVINGVQRTYRWLRSNGFKTFNHYWDFIDIENGDVHDTIIELIQYLKGLDNKEVLAMYNDMLPALEYNKQRFFEFAKEQQYKMENLFK